MKNEVSVKCACGHAIMEMSTFDDGTTSIVFYEAYQPSLWLRIKKAWGYIRGKRLDCQDFILYDTDMGQISMFINENYSRSGITSQRLQEIATEIDEWLSKETPESMREWIDSHRRKQALDDMARMNQETGQYDPPFNNPLINKE